MTETGWLIESNFSFPTPRWLRIVTYGVDANRRAEVVWTEESSVALRFGRKQDAEFFVYLHPEHGTLARVTEHVWQDPALAQEEEP